MLPLANSACFAGADRREFRWRDVDVTCSVIATSWLGTGEHGHRCLDVGVPHGDDAMVVAQVVGTGGQGSGSYAADAARMVLTELLAPPRRAVPVRTPPEDTWALELAAWVPALVERTPLPAAPAALLAELARRIGAVTDALNAKGAALRALGVLAHVAGHIVTLDRRGCLRVYVVRDGAVSCLVREHSLEEHLRATGQPVEGRTPRGVSMSHLGACEAEPAVVVELAPGDRLVIVPWLVYERCPDELVLRAVLDPTTASRELPARCDESWAITALEARRTIVT